jgi:hypothetical protein
VKGKAKENPFTGYWFSLDALFFSEKKDVKKRLT